MHTYALNCTLKSGPSSSSTDAIIDLVARELAFYDVGLTRDRVVDHDIRPGVSSDEGDGDEWPLLRRSILGSELFLLATPIWMGHPSSIAQRVLERLDAFLAEKDEYGRIVSTDRVAMVAVVGNEDGAHQAGAQLFQGLNDVGFTIPAEGMTYWVGEAMGSTDFKDLATIPDSVVGSTRTMVARAVHLATLLQASSYPAEGDGTGH